MTARPENSQAAPYVGLRPFEFHEASLFYGRGEHIAEMLQTLSKGHFLAVIGSSGSGKSSLVRAGLLPAIADGFMDGDEDEADWRFVRMRPGLDPYGNLLQALLPELSSSKDLDPEVVEFRRQTLRGGPRGLVEVIADSLLPEPTRLVVLVDQFEEIFRFLERGGPSRVRDDGSDVVQRNNALAFVSLLLATAAERDRRVYVVLTMRSEYLGECEAFLGLSAAISKFQFLTPRLTREQILDIIERSLRSAGGQIEPAVVTAILNSLGTAQDQLPRVEHVLLRMWDRAAKVRENPEAPLSPVNLSLDDYQAVGRFESALDQHAEQIYDELGPGSESDQPSEKQRVAEQMFRSLAVRTAQGTLVRRLSSVGEVASIAGVSEQLVAEVVEQFRQPGCNFVVATPAEQFTTTTTLDISHESLLRQWGRMQRWVTTEADAAAELQRLVSDAKSWHARNRGTLRQPELGVFQKWRKKVPSPQWAGRYVKPEEFDLADEYLLYSLWHKRIVQGIAVTAALAMVVLTVLSVHLTFVAREAVETSDHDKKNAEENARKATANEREAKHQLAMNHLDGASVEIERGNGANGIFRYWQAYCAAPNDDPLWWSARSLLASWSSQHGIPLVHDGSVGIVAFSPDGLTVVTGSNDKTARLWDAKTGQAKGARLQHQGSVLSVAFSPDGLTVLTASADSTARMWDAKTGLAKGMPLRHQAGVVAVAISPDGLTVLTGSEDRTARLWDGKNGQAKRAPLQHQGSVLSVAFSPDGLTVLTGSDDKTARLWDAKTGQAKGAPLQHEGSVLSVAFSPDGLTVLTGDDDMIARLWDAKTGQVKGTPLVHQGTVWSVAFSPDGQTLLTGSADGVARLADAKTGLTKGVPLVHQNDVGVLAFSPDGETVLTGSADNSARLWDAKTGQPKGAPILHQGIVRSVAFSPNGDTVLTGSADKTARLSDAKTGKARGGPFQHKGDVAIVVFSRDGQTVLTGSRDKIVRLWDAKNGQAKGGPIQCRGVLRSVALSPDGRVVLTGSVDKTARLWDAKTGQAKGEPLQHLGIVTSVAFSPDGQTVFTGSEDKTARLWDAKTGKAKGTPLQHQGIVSCVAFNPNEQTLLTGSYDMTARLWDAKTGQAKGTPLQHKGFVACVAFSPDGQTVLTGSHDMTARLWDAKTGQAKGMPLQHQDVVISVAFSPDGETVLTGSRDMTARLWDAKTGQAKGTPLLHFGSVTSAVFSPDGQTVLTGSYDMTARLWDVKTAKLKGALLQHLGTVWSVAFSPDGQTALTGSGDNSARLWNIVPPAADDPERLRLSVEVRTGLYLDANGMHAQLTQNEWLDRRAQLDKLGGFCDVRSWDDLTDAEKLELRTPQTKR